MRFNIPLGLALAVSYSVASPLRKSEPRDEPAGHAAHAGGAMALPSLQKALKIDSITPTIPKPGVKAIRMKYGPYKLRVAGVR